MTDLRPDGEYLYKGLPLTPAIIGELATEIFAGRLARRNEIDSVVVQYHADRGGAPSQAASTLPQTKKALQMLARQGRVEETAGYGVWRFPKRGVIERPGLGPVERPGLDIVTNASEVAEPSDPIKVESEVGPGAEKELVYVYSYPAYRRVAELEGRDSWPVKIERSDSLWERLRAQAGTGGPDWPVVHLAIHTDAAPDLERFLHLALKLNGRQLVGPDTEWFDTSPTWVMSLIRSAVPAILKERR